MVGIQYSSCPPSSANIITVMSLREVGPIAHCDGALCHSYLTDKEYYAPGYRTTYEQHLHGKAGVF